ncbi:MAG: hypothetical protein BHW03_00075 [Clostridium sp. 28_17]|nr:MAG: hypothetical protein BHW03_00075 [Clostridium sp. 28_17]
MSKFWVKVKVKQEKNAEHLIRAFFQDFNPASSIVVRGKEAKMEIVFREPPMAIIDAINHCEVIELNYGKNLKEYKEDEDLQVETENDSKQRNVGVESSEKIEQTNVESEDSEQPEQTNVESENSEQPEPTNAENENSEQTEQPKKKRGSPATKKLEPKKETKSEPTINIPKLEEIAKKSNSFEHFAELVAKWLEMGKRKDFFKNLIIVSAEVDKIKWKELEKALKNKNVFYTKWDKIWSGQQVSEKLKEYSATMLSFLNVTKKYKEYSFKEVEEYSTEENSSKQDVEKTTTNFEEKTDKFNETVFPKPRVKMECMPEIKEFEETLASVDKTQPVEERVRYVLGAMGLNNMSVKEQKQIVEIASTAVKKGRMAFDIIFVEANIPIEQTMTVRMTFSKFVNDFVQKYESGKKVKLLTFLSELQKIIMFESEIESFSDFTD